VEDLVSKCNRREHTTPERLARQQRLWLKNKYSLGSVTLQEMNGSFKNPKESAWKQSCVHRDTMPDKN
jgi:hypothetical protein